MGSHTATKSFQEIQIRSTYHLNTSADTDTIMKGLNLMLFFFSLAVILATAERENTGLHVPGEHSEGGEFKFGVKYDPCTTQAECPNFHKCVVTPDQGSVCLCMDC